MRISEQDKKTFPKGNLQEKFFHLKEWWFLKLWLFAHLSHLSSKKSTKSCDIYSRAFLIVGIQCSLLDGVCFYKQELRLLMFLWVS